MQTYVPLTAIDDNPYQRRAEYGDLDDLAQRILAKRRDYPDTYGLMQVPIGRVVRHNPLLGPDEPLSAFQVEQLLREHNGLPPNSNLRVQLAFGHRRLRAFQLLAERHPNQYGQTMPLNLLALTDDQMLDACWSENRERRELSAVEEAELLAEKLERARAEGGNQETVALAWGLSRSTVANRIRLLDLPAEAQQANRDGRLSERQALALLSVTTLADRLNGNDIQWGDNSASHWNPTSPAGYIAHVIANPDKATSDDIRRYVATAARYAGRPLGESFIAFDAGQGKAIIQPTCKGCPKRLDTHCFHRPCHDARRGHYFDAIPEWAARETGLPVGDEADFPTDWSTRNDIEAQWKSGNHDNLVVGVDRGSAVRPFSDSTYCDEDELLRDWKRGVRLGRRVATAADIAAGAPEAVTLELRPRPSERAAWKKAQAKADKDRLKRTQRALADRIRPLADDETASRALLAMLDGHWIDQHTGLAEPPTADDLAEKLFEEAWKRADTYHYEDTNRAVLRKLLHRASINPDFVDPPDSALRLLDIGQSALLYYEERRARIDAHWAKERLAVVRQALDEFTAAAYTVAGNHDLQALQLYLRAAVEREEKIVYTTPVTEEDVAFAAIIKEWPDAGGGDPAP